MRPIEIKRRRHWQQHIRDNAYQVEALTNQTIGYWTEALAVPYAIQLSEGEEEALSKATEALWEMSCEFLDRFFTEESPGAVTSRLKTLGILPEYHRAIASSWAREAPEDLELATRFDLATRNQALGDISGSELSIKLIEINGETPLLGAEMVYQWNWFCNYRSQFPSGDKALPDDAYQFNEYWEKIANRFRVLANACDFKGRGVSFLVDETLEEDLEMAMQLIQILHDEVDDQIYTQIVTLRDDYDEDGKLISRGIGLDSEGYLVDGQNDRMPIIWKIYDWHNIQADMASDRSTTALVNRLEKDDISDQIIIEPLWKQVLSNKGAMVYMWQWFRNHPTYGQYLLPTYFETDLSMEATQLAVGIHIRKPIIGHEGVGISILDPAVGDIEAKPALGYGEEGYILQEFFELPVAALGQQRQHYMIGAWSVDGEAAGIVIRGDGSRITGRYCTIIPHIVAGAIQV
ncbi:MAG: glutathionylspermidine synthase family protein [Synechococcales cyanobacterium RM1_1_8]|nr:glutathionylspermidine synthase family protein [Synechococcales cyanobacterium RM1_1_8]